MAADRGAAPGRLEHFSLDGVRYEAFNTSGGLGTLCETLAGRVRTLNYKTMRYRGHRDLMALPDQRTAAGRTRALLKEILETAIPITMQDVVVVFCTVTGRSDGELVQITTPAKFISQTIDGEAWSAIQITTAAGVCGRGRHAFRWPAAGDGKPVSSDRSKSIYRRSSPIASASITTEPCRFPSAEPALDVADDQPCCLNSIPLHRFSIG